MASCRVPHHEDARKESGRYTSEWRALGEELGGVVVRVARATRERIRAPAVQHGAKHNGRRRDLGVVSRQSHQQLYNHAWISR